MASGSPAQINMLLQYKGGADEEECPVPHGIRGELLRFHSDLLAHCGEMGALWGGGGQGDPRGGDGGMLGPLVWGYGDVRTPCMGMWGCWDPRCGDMGTWRPPGWGCGDVGTPGVGIWGHGDPLHGMAGPPVWGLGDPLVGM